ncbi:MAG TPA: toprim domain-containing protein [Thermoplasmata archaeon]|jgi:5S rRNA maturation endonuclease (ribonuclease M5)
MPSPEKLLERLKDMQTVIDELIDLSETVPVIVEGRRDVQALGRIGVVHNVLPLNKGVSIFQFCEQISMEFREAIILTDLDHRGGKLARALKEGLSANGVRANEKIRSRIALVSAKEVRDIESLPSYLERLRSKSPEKDR